MKVTTERLENCQIKVIIELDAATADKYLRQTARKISRQFNIPGYRRGKAPYHTVTRVFGQEALQQEVLDDFGQDLYDEALKEIEFEPYAVGELQDVEWDPFRMTIVLPVSPEVDLGDYRSVRLDLEPQPVTDEMIEEYLQAQREKLAQWVPVERAATYGDAIVLDAQGTSGEEEVLDLQEHEMVLTAGVMDPVAGFAEKILDMEPQEEKTFALTYPEEFEDEDLAGREVTFQVQLHTVRERNLPPLDDDLAMMIGDYDSLDQLRVATREGLETQRLEQAESEFFDRVLEALIEIAVKIEYPPQAIDREVDLTLHQMEQNLAASGMQLDHFLRIIGKSLDQYKQEVRPAAQDRLKKRLVLNEIPRLEGLTVEEDEIDKEIERMRGVAGSEDAEMLEMLQSPGGRMMLADDLLSNKARERILQIAKGEAPPLAQREEQPETTEPGDDATPVPPEAEAEVVPPEVEQEADVTSEDEAA